MSWKAIAAGMMLMGAGACSAAADPIDREVSVCVAGAPANYPAGSLNFAKDITSKIYAKIGVRIDWRKTNGCPAGAINIGWDSEPDPSKHPGALAYALVYEGTTIVILTDRVKAAVQPRTLPQLLGHVLAHEIGHILQGVNRHSETGVLKAYWTKADLAALTFQSLAFTAEDADLIHRGADFRANRLMADLHPTTGR